jgi:hypothetical protein
MSGAVLASETRLPHPIADAIALPVKGREEL